MAIVQHRTFTHALASFIDGDLSQVAKLRSLNEGFQTWSYSEFASIVYHVVNNRWHEDEGASDATPFHEEIKAIREQWGKFSKESGDEDYERGQNAAWDAVDDELGRIMDRQFIELFEMAGESELASIGRVSYDALLSIVSDGEASLARDPQVIKDLYCCCDNNRLTLTPVLFGPAGEIKGYAR